MTRNPIDEIAEEMIEETMLLEELTDGDNSDDLDELLDQDDPED